MQNRSHLGHRAVVIGGSIAGMLSARVLSEFFTEVLILEAGEPQHDIHNPRKRVPQGYHSHILLQSGQNVLNTLFPGFIDELTESGSVTADFTNDLEWFHFGAWKNRFASGIRGIQQTRPFLEWHIRNRLEKYDNVRFHYGSQVTDYLSSPDGKTILGVKLAKRDEHGGDDRFMADLIVDASGYGSQTPKWLSNPALEDNSEAVKIDLFYATRFYEADLAARDVNWKNLMISAQLPEQPFAGVVLSFENQQFGVTLGGYLQPPPRTEADFHAIAKALPQPHVYNFIQNAKPISDLKTYRIPSQVRKHYDKVRNFPARLVVLGDAYCRFDPIYGQGMSVAALGANLLHQELIGMTGSNELDELHKTFYTKLNKLTQNPWDMATTESLRHPEIQGTRSAMTALKQRLTKRIYEKSAVDENIYFLLAQVMNLTASPNVFFKPAILRKLLL